jgi:hypothetical protein
LFPTCFPAPRRRKRRETAASRRKAEAKALGSATDSFSSEISFLKVIFSLHCINKIILP